MPSGRESYLHPRRRRGNGKPRGGGEKKRTGMGSFQVRLPQKGIYHLQGRRSGREAKLPVLPPVTGTKERQYRGGEERLKKGFKQEALQFFIGGLMIN